MRMRACLTAAVLLIAPFSPAMAQTVGYGLAFDELYRIDLSARQASYVGQAGNFAGQPFGFLKGLTFGPGNTLYAVSDSLSQKPLVTINTTSGAASYVAALNLTGGTGQFNSLDFGAAFTCDGQMWLSSATAGKLWKVSPSNGATTVVGDLGQTVTGLAARGNELFGAGGRGNNSLYRIDTATGAAQLIGGFGAANSGWISSISMNFDAAGVLWAVFNYLPPAPGGSTLTDWSDLATIDPTTGAATVLGPITGPESLRGIGLSGFALGPTPCAAPPPDGGNGPSAALPSTSNWSLLLLLLLTVAFAGWRLGAARQRP